MDRQIAATKFILFLLCLLPGAYFSTALWQDALGANPIEAFSRSLGDWTFYLLLITLSVTPLRRLSGHTWLLRLRRMLGLFVVFYAALHMLSYLWLDMALAWGDIGIDLLKRPFIVPGMLGFLLLIPLAVTSNSAMVSRLGGRRWQRLHRLIYPAALLGLLHYTWMAKAGSAQPLWLGVLLVGLLGLRLWWYVMDARKPLLEQRQRQRRIIPIQPRR